MGELQKYALDAYNRIKVERGEITFIDAFVEGFNLAEKIFALTREDMKYISELYDKIPHRKKEDFYDEMLRRFKEYKKNMNRVNG